LNVLILSSSRNEINAKYLEITKDIAKFLANNDCDLVFGASSNSMMGVCYKEFCKNKRNVYAYTTLKYKDDLDNLKESRQYICTDTFEMKQKMFNKSDLIVCLPGGLGTLSELLTYIEEKRSNDKNIPIIIYNENNYYEKLFELIEEMINNKFIDESIYQMFKIVNNEEEFYKEYLNLEEIWKN
jgi:hypothetical protein